MHTLLPFVLVAECQLLNINAMNSFERMHTHRCLNSQLSGNFESSASTLAASWQTYTIFSCRACNWESVRRLQRSSGCTLEWYNTSSTHIKLNGCDQHAASIRTCHPVPDACTEGLVQKQSFNRTSSLQHRLLEVRKIRHPEEWVKSQCRNGRFCERRSAQAHTSETTCVEKRDFGALARSTIRHCKNELAQNVNWKSRARSCKNSIPS